MDHGAERPAGEDWGASWHANHELQLTAGLSATPAQRLAWLEEALWLATQVAAPPSALVEREASLDLPGADLIGRGLADLSRGRATVEALLVSIGAPRLQQLGLSVHRPLADPEHRLYELLGRSHADSAHSRYNALVRRLVSFERAFACAR